MKEPSDRQRASRAERTLIAYADITQRTCDLGNRETARQLTDSLRADLDAYIRVMFRSSP